MTPGTAFTKALAAESLPKALAKLDAERQVLDAREFRLMTGAREAGLTYAEIARAKGCSTQAVGNWFGRRDADGNVLPRMRVADRL